MPWILDIEGAIKMGSSDKIQWVNTGTYILGTDSTMTIDADDTYICKCGYINHVHLQLV